MTIRACVLLAASAATLFVGPANATITISTDTTQNITCMSGVCSPTASNAVLNVNDLENLLASGNVEVTTAGSGVDAEDIDLEAALTWSSSSALSLVATQAIKVDQPVAVTGVSALSIIDGGSNEDLSFGTSGKVSFSSLSSNLTINGQAYALVKSVKSLARGIKKQPSGYFALAKSFDARKDGIYTSDPVPEYFYGILEGLGNSVSHINIGDGHEAVDGFFEVLYVGSQVRDFSLTRIRVLSSGNTLSGLAGGNFGEISNCHVSGSLRNTARGRYIYPVVGGLVSDNGNQGQPGTIRASSSSVEIIVDHKPPIAGGLVGVNIAGTIEESSAMGGIAFRSSEKRSLILGGLVGENESEATIIQSFATDSISGGGQKGGKGSAESGGLVGQNDGTIEDSYATGSTSNLQGESESNHGGLVGLNGGTITQSYSTGAFSNDTGYLGGLIGYDDSTSGSLSYDYWDTDLSGITNLSQGAGYPANDTGITGLSTMQFQSGLPTGFDPNVWTENSSINGGLPYLIANPPPT